MPALGKLSQTDLGQLSDLAKEEYLSRKTEIGLRWSYYKRKQKNWIIDPKSKQPTSENVVINVTKKVVNQTVSFLFGKAPEIKAGDDLKPDIEKLLDDNKDATFFTNLGKEGSISGHCFVKLVPDDEIGVRWVLQQTALVTVYWRPDDGNRAIAYKIQWTVAKNEYRQDIIYQPESKSWLIRDMEKEDKGDWKITNSGGIGLNWNYPFSPMVDWQNLPDSSSYYGESDVQAIDLNDSINFLASNTNRIIKYHAHPRTVGTGIKSDEVTETSVDGFYTTENAAAKIYNLEMQSDLISSMNFLNFLKDAFFSEQQAVDIDAIKQSFGDVTNLGIKMLFNDAMSKNDIKKELYGYGLKELVYRSLVILQKSVLAKDVSVKFADPLPKNQNEIAQTTQIKLESGVISKQTGAERNDENWALEQTRMAEEKTGDDADLGQALMDAIEKANAKNPAGVQ